MLLAAELNVNIKCGAAAAFAAKAVENGILVNAVSPTAIRLAPALTITDVELGQALSAWERTCEFFAGYQHV
jgi:acetylornithine/succinyldiaminopimelate/putrescine aminotransferase